MKLKIIACTGILLTGSNLAIAESSSTHNNVLSDRATFDDATGKLHVPYVTTEIPGFSKLGIDLFLNPRPDSQGRLLFSLDNHDLHTLHDPHFEYEGEAGPEHWAHLTTDYVSCGIGKSQSPINIADNADTTVSVDLSDINFNYTSSAVNILNNGHTVQVNYDGGSSINLNGKTYELLQFHFHTPSEHAINGENLPMEMHLVHKSEDGALAVVGVLIKAGAENTVFASVVAGIPAHESVAVTIADATVDANQLMPADHTEYRYSGSLTTPPCSEGVKWLVLQTPVEMSQVQIDAFSSVMGHNNRPLQAINAREILVNSQ